MVESEVFLMPIPPPVAAALITSAMGGVDMGLRASGIGQGGTEGLSTADQRWLADFQWKQSLRNEDLQRQQYQFAKDQFEYQKQLNQHGLKWRVDDAVSAGLHPLTALGSNSTFSPIQSAFSFGSSFGSGPRSKNPSGLADSISRMGQSLAHGISATQTKMERLLDEVRLANEIKQGNFIDQQIAESQARIRTMGPPFPELSIPKKPMYIDYVDAEGNTYRVQSPEYAASHMNKPITSLSQDLWDIGSKGIRGVYDINKNLVWPSMKKGVHYLINPLDIIRGR